MLDVRHIAGAALLGVGAMLLASCTPSQPAQISSYRAQDRLGLPGQTVAVVPPGDGGGRGLQGAHFDNALAERLARQGFAVVSPDAGPDYVAMLDYQVDPGRPHEEVYEYPVYETVERYVRRNDKLIAVPYHVFLGYRTERRLYTYYPAHLQVTLFRGGSEESVYEGRVTTEGPCGNPDALVEPLLDSMFEQFPGGNGDVRNVTVELPNC